MERSRGFKSRSRSKLTKKVREKGRIPISRTMQEFKPGDRVHIVIDPSVQKGQPHPRYHGRTGTVTEKRGNAYVIEVTDKNARKTLISRPVHLRSQEGVE